MTGISLTAAHTGSCLHGDLATCALDIPLLPPKAINWGLSQLGSGVKGAISDTAGSAWDAICQSFADACTTVLGWFATAFVAMPGPDLASIRGIYGISLTLGMIVALILVVCQAGAVLWTRSGAPLAQALTGVVKAALASLLTLTVADQVLRASDQLASWIIASSGTSVNAFSRKLVTLLAFGSLASVNGTSVLLLIFGLLGLLAVVVLWAELLLRNAALAVIVATAPISAAGQIGTGTQDWWRKLVKAGLQLAVLKPVIALVFAIGFSMTGTGQGLTGVLSGLVVLILATFAWPIIARFFTFTSVAIGGGVGAAALVGAVANRGGGAGVDPGAFGQFSERQALAANAARAASAGGGDSTGHGAGAASGAGGRGGGVAAQATMAAQVLQRTLNTLASRMEQHAGHGGIEGANPTAYPAGFPAAGPIRRPTRPAPSNSAPSSTGDTAPPPQPAASASALATSAAGTASAARATGPIRPTGSTGSSTSSTPDRR